MGKRLGFMYIAKRACGKASAMAWDDPGYGKATAKLVAGWIRRGDKVERVERFEGDPQPEWICIPCTRCTGDSHVPFIEGPFGEMPKDR
jgi:hypothetical protein